MQHSGPQSKPKLFLEEGHEDGVGPRELKPVGSSGTFLLSLLPEKWCCAVRSEIGRLMVEGFFRNLLNYCFYCVPAFCVYRCITSIKQVAFVLEMSTGVVCNNLQKAKIISVPLSILSFTGRYTLLLGTR